MSKIFIYSILTAIVIGFSNCTNVPDGVVSESKMEKILYDSYLGEGLSESELTPIYETKAKDLYLKSVLKKYDVSQKEYDASLTWYMQHLDIYTKIYDKVLVKLKKEEAKLKMESGDSTFASEILKGDTVELWRNSSEIYLSGVPLIGNLLTEIKTNETFVLGDSIFLKADVHLFYASKRQAPRIVLTLNYQNDSAKTITQPITETRIYTIKIQADTTKRLNSIVAGFYQNQSSVLSVKGISLKRIHKKKK